MIHLIGKIKSNLCWVDDAELSSKRELVIKICEDYLNDLIILKGSLLASDIYDALGAKMPDDEENEEFFGDWVFLKPVNDEIEIYVGYSRR